jgi:hypothetical protein
MSTTLQLDKTQGGAASREKEKKKKLPGRKACKFFIRASTQMDAHMRAHALVIVLKMLILLFL